MIENVGGSEKNNLRGTLVYLGSTWHKSDSSSNRGVGKATPNISVRVSFFEETFFFPEEKLQFVVLSSGSGSLLGRGPVPNNFLNI